MKIFIILVIVMNEFKFIFYNLLAPQILLNPQILNEASLSLLLHTYMYTVPQPCTYTNTECPLHSALYTYTYLHTIHPTLIPTHSTPTPTHSTPIPTHSAPYSTHTYTQRPLHYTYPHTAYPTPSPTHSTPTPTHSAPYPTHTYTQRPLYHTYLHTTPPILYIPTHSVPYPYTQHP